MFAVKPLLVLALATTVLSLPSPQYPNNKAYAMSIAQKLSGPPAGWVKDDAAEVDKDRAMVTLRIHLKAEDMDKFYDLATKIATPGHELYGKHLSQEVLNKMVSPTQDSQDLVMNWLSDRGLNNHIKMSPRSDSIIIEASVAQVEKLLDAEYSAFVRPATGEKILRTLEYSLPDSIKDHISLVQPTTFFGLRAMRSTSSGVTISGVTAVDEEISGSSSTPAVTGCSGGIINPSCLSNLYNYASDTTNASAGLMGIAGFLEEYPSVTDLTKFMKQYATQNNAGQSYSCAPVNGGSCSPPSTVGLEANLDVQYARAITKFVPNTFYSTGGRPPYSGKGDNTNEPYLDFLNYLLTLPAASLPNTLSISYGDDEATVPLDYADTCCNLFSQLGSLGVSVLVASGDSGVGTTCSVNGATRFTTSFPAGCPWVTTVGGTTGNSPERAWTNGGGGFSEVFGVPLYQSATVNNWLTTDTTHDGVIQYFNSSGRAYPDVAAQATNFAVVIDGSSTSVDGTSCATPTFASIMQLINSDRISSGKSGLGFLNPWLYSSAVSGFTDIRRGGITGCSGAISGAGFSAVPGWDPATGLGTPNYASLLAISRNT